MGTLCFLDSLLADETKARSAYRDGYCGCCGFVGLADSCAPSDLAKSTDLSDFHQKGFSHWSDESTTGAIDLRPDTEYNLRPCGREPTPGRFS